MTNRKIIVLAILIVGLFAFSAVSAADNLTDDVASTDFEINEVTSSDNLKTEEVISNDDNVTEDRDVLAVGRDDEVSIEDNDDVLSISSPSYSQYSLSVYDTAINEGSSGSVTIHITPVSSSSYYAYDFYFRVYDSNGNQKISENLYSSSRSTSYTYTIPANKLSVGTYTIKLVNYYDGRVMDTAKLTVKSSNYPSSSDYSVNVSDVSMDYENSGSITMSISPASSYYKYYYYLKVYDSNYNEKISQLYYSTSSDSSKTYSLSSSQLSTGAYHIEIINYADDMVMDTAKLTVKSFNCPSSSDYSVSVSDVSMNYAYGEGSISMKISPASRTLYKYYYYLKVYDSMNNEKFSELYSGSDSSYSKTYSFGSTQLSPGIYEIRIINFLDDVVMDTAKLTVKSSNYPSSSDYSVSVSDVSVNYGYSGSISMKISPASRTSYDYYYYLKVYDSSDNEKISQVYSSFDSASSKTYSLSSKSLDPGVYTIKLVNYFDNNVMGTAKLTVYNRNIQFMGMTGNCTGDVEFKVRISEDDKFVSGQKVTFNCNGKQFSSTSDSQGYASFKTHLKAGTYDVTTNYAGISNKNTIAVNKVYVGNDYRNAHIQSMTGHYNGKNKISYSWEGNLKGYFRIYKGNNIIYETEFNTNGYISDYMAYDKHDYYYEGSEINAVGTYKAVIADENGNELAKASIVITKAPTHTNPKSGETPIGSLGILEQHVLDESGSSKNIGGTAKLKIAGKTYKAKVKDGIAQFKVKMPIKAKTYKGILKFSGDKNYKGCSASFKIKLYKTNMVILKKNKSIKVGKYTIKLSSKQYKSLVKAFNKGKYKSIKIVTNYKHKVKVPYTKAVKQYKTTTAVKTWYAGSYLPMINRMEDNGWTLVSEYTYTKANPQHKYGIGLSAYTYAVCKWVKVSYKTAYKTKSYPVKAKITNDPNYIIPFIELYSHGDTLKFKGIAIA
ncbi:hypothetical protein [uncultured Methanobrevibacter sp.]|uniref:hypothetical protein n=1 Tax=uncultured Methanobrevibacter sp. TaxID=253161 RepID=UPI0025EC3B5E|nr:hypothetical protein [uncultured Methanobrevibacter sp.]